MFAAALFGGLFAALAMLLMGGDLTALTKTMRTLVEGFVKNELPQIPGANPLTDPQIDEIAIRALGLLPWSLAALSLITTLLNLWLAGRITLASGRLTRPWPDLSQICAAAGRDVRVADGNGAGVRGRSAGIAGWRLCRCLHDGVRAASA